MSDVWVTAKDIWGNQIMLSEQSVYYIWDQNLLETVKHETEIHKNETQCTHDNKFTCEEPQVTFCSNKHKSYIYH